MIWTVPTEPKRVGGQCDFSGEMMEGGNLSAILTDCSDPENKPPGPCWEAPGGLSAAALDLAWKTIPGSGEGVVVGGGTCSIPIHSGSDLQPSTEALEKELDCVGRYFLLHLAAGTQGLKCSDWALVSNVSTVLKEDSLKGGQCSTERGGGGGGGGVGWESTGGGGGGGQVGAGPWKM